MIRTLTGTWMTSVIFCGAAFAQLAGAPGAASEPAGAGVARACSTAEDCDDGLSCTADDCVEGECVNQVIDDADCNNNGVADASSVRL